MNDLAILCAVIMLMFSVNSSSAQKTSVKTYEIKKVDIDYDKGTICLDLIENLEVVYDETYEMGSIRPVLKPLRDDSKNPEAISVVGGGTKVICFNTPEGFLTPGVYIFQVMRNGSLDHLIKFVVKAPQPKAKLSILQNGAKAGTLNIDYANILKVQFVFSASSKFFENKKPKIEFQGHELKIKSIELDKLVAEMELNIEQVQKVKLGTHSISLSHSDWGIEEYSLTVESDVPKINSAHTITYTNHIGQVPINLDVSNVSPNAQICVQCDKQDVGCPIVEKCYAILSRNNGTISSNINIGLASHGDTGSFMASIKNRDGKTSDKVRVIVEPLDVTADLSVRDENKPIISGLKSDVVITSKNGVFDPSKDFNIKVQGNNIPIVVEQSSSSSTLFCEIDVPKDIFGAKLKFELENNNQTWRGQIAKISEIPSLELGSIVFRRNQEFTLNYDNKVKGVTLVNNQQGVEIMDADISDGIGKLKLTSDFFDEKLIIGTRIDARETILDSYNLKEWTSPDNAFTIGNKITTYKNRPIINLQDGQDIIVKPNGDLVDDNSNEKIYVQLFNKEGTAVGDQNILRYRKYKELKVYPKGFSAGDEFLIEFKTVDEQKKTYIGYIKRPFIDRLSLSAGLNGIRFSFKDDNNPETPKHQILGGITAGVFCSFERKRSSETSLLSAGIYGNFAESEDGSELDSSLGIALLLAERVSIGVDIIGTSAITIGANINILDFSKLIGAATDKE